jgi:Flp pilus assembly protein TadG
MARTQKTAGQRKQSGAAVIYMFLCMVPVIACGSLAVDLGHVMLVKTQLQGAVDAAARSAAQNLMSGGSSSTASSAAITSAAANKVDSVSQTLLSSDVVIGNWSSNTFTANGTPANAARVTGYRKLARGTAVQLTLLTIIGRGTFDLSASALVTEVPATAKYGIVAMSGVNINNAFTADSYNSSLGSYASGPNQNASIANGGSGWNISSTTDIKGKLYYTGSAPAGGTVTGGRQALPSSPTLSTLYPMVTTPTGTTAGGNYNGGNLSLTAGNYSYTSFNQNAGNTLTITGNVNIYVSGNINLNGIVNNNGIPGHLSIYNTAAAGVNIGGTGTVFALIYAPASPINLNGNAQVYGAMIGTSFNSGGGTQVHVDEALLTSATGGKITAVQ